MMDCVKKDDAGMNGVHALSHNVKTDDDGQDLHEGYRF